MIAFGSFSTKFGVPENFQSQFGDCICSGELDRSLNDCLVCSGELDSVTSGTGSGAYRVLIECVPRDRGLVLVIESL